MKLGGSSLARLVLYVEKENIMRVGAIKVRRHRKDPDEGLSAKTTEPPNKRSNKYCQWCHAALGRALSPAQTEAG